MTRVIWIIAVLAGCTDLPDREAGVCGNGVVEPGDAMNGRPAEDCDSNEPSCQSCRVTCPTGTDEECANIGKGSYRCGADFICHAPSGVFRQEPRVSFPFVVGQGAVADLDGDRIGDVIGFSDITIDVRFGDLAGDLTTRSTTLLPYTNTSIALREFEPRHVDILVPTPDGIAAYTATAGQQLVSYPFKTAPGGGSDDCLSGPAEEYTPLATFTLDERRMAFVARHGMTGAARIGVFDIVTTECQAFDGCGMTLQPPPAGQAAVVYDHYLTQAETMMTSMSSVIAVGAVAAPTATTQQVCVVRFSGVPNSFSFTSLMPTFTVPIFTMQAIPLALARATVGAVCPALFVPSSTGIDAYAATLAGTPSTCALQPTPSAMPGFAAGDAATGHIPLVPAISMKAPDALVVITDTGFLAQSDVYSLTGTTTKSFMYHSPRPLLSVAAGDLDGDGRIEAVATARPVSGQGQPDLDVLYRTAPPVDSFVPYRITTQGAPTHIALGDYDGNGISDIAYTERFGASELLMLAYGTRDRPLPAVPITEFHNVVTLARLDLPDSIEPTGQVLDDLLVADLILPADPMMMSEPLLTILHGNPQRSMLAYYDPRPFGTMTSSRFAAAVTGNFADTSAADVLVFNVNTLTDAVTMYVAPGSAGTQQLGEATSVPAPSIASAVCPSDAKLCLNGARFLPWHVGDHDVVIAIDAQQGRLTRRLVTVDPLSGDVRPATNDTATIPPGVFVFSIWPADLGAGGAPHLLVASGMPRLLHGDKTTNQVLDCSVDASGVVTSCVDLATEIEGYEDWTCQSHAQGWVSARGRHDNPDDSTDSLVLCWKGGESHVLRLHRDGTRYRAVTVVELAGLADFISVGDINGDRLDDVSTVTFDPNFQPIIDVHLQCDATNTECRGGK